MDAAGAQEELKAQTHVVCPGGYQRKKTNRLFECLVFPQVNTCLVGSLFIHLFVIVQTTGDRLYEYCKVGTIRKNNSLAESFNVEFNLLLIYSNFNHFGCAPLQFINCQKYHRTLMTVVYYCKY